MTEQQVVRKFINYKWFHGHYVSWSLCCHLYVRYMYDATLVFIKPEDLKRLQYALNSFYRNLKFTLYTFNDIGPLFLGTKLYLAGLGIYCKPTNTGQYTHYTSF